MLRMVAGMLVRARTWFLRYMVKAKERRRVLGEHNMFHAKWFVIYTIAESTSNRKDTTNTVFNVTAHSFG